MEVVKGVIPLQTTAFELRREDRRALLSYLWHNHINSVEQWVHRRVQLGCSLVTRRYSREPLLVAGLVTTTWSSLNSYFILTEKTQYSSSVRLVISDSPIMLCILQVSTMELNMDKPTFINPNGSKRKGESVESSCQRMCKQTGEVGPFWCFQLTESSKDGFANGLEGLCKNRGKRFITMA